MKNYFLFILVISLFTACDKPLKTTSNVKEVPYLLVLGNAQDAGYPQAGCEQECCQRVYENPENGHLVSSLALVDPATHESWIFDATPDFPKQLKALTDHLHKSDHILPNGIFLTHAHIGHYTGLMHLGREAMGANQLKVFAMPKMVDFLKGNGPWSQLVTLKNIQLNEISKEQTVVLNDRISVTAIPVPHRDEFSETVGFLIHANKKKFLFIPDIDKWNIWDKNIVDYLKQVDIALLDGTFFKDGEIKGRPMSEIPHPFVEESMELFKDLPETDKKKIYFIHFNHTNPLLIENSEAQQKVMSNGFQLAKQGDIIY